jgi:hypothetical protein
LPCRQQFDSEDVRVFAIIGCSRLAANVAIGT